MNSLPAEFLHCPSCRRSMVALCVGALPLGHLALDYCATCRGLWFDPYESTRLAPESILELFRIIRNAEETDTQSLAATLACPRCGQTLLITRDVARGGPISYHRCPNGHGRYTPFAHFLTEKGFVRHIAKSEIKKIAASIGPINCHACGGPIDLRADTACPHCRSPIAVLDIAAMAHAFEGYGAAAAQRIRGVSEDLIASSGYIRFRPQRRAASLLELGIRAVAQQF